MSKFYYILTSLDPIRYDFGSPKHWPHKRYPNQVEARKAKSLVAGYCQILQIDTVTFKPVKFVR